MFEHRRLASASLTDPINDPADRNVMPMSTLIASDMWLLEVSWDGTEIGDVQVFKNKSCAANGERKVSEKLDRDRKPIPVEDEWVWWGGVPRGKIKSYRFVDQGQIRPMTVDEGLPFELPKKNAQREEKPVEAGKGGATGP